MTDQHTLAAHFRSLHTAATPLVLVNAWDAAGAAIVADAGAPAVATTSAGVAWALGTPDGDALGRDEAVALIARITATVTVPVTADIESGYGATPADVATTVQAVIAAGAVGINIEDALHGGDTALRTPAAQAERVAAARAAADDAGIPLFINVRTDTFLRAAGGTEETIARAHAYLEAGADGIFVPGVAAPDTIAALTAAIPAPVNIMAGPGSPSVPELAKLGVARVSLGASVAAAAYGLVQRAAVEAYTTGTYDSAAEGVDYMTMNGLLRR